jgi:hypothetical protein
VKRAAIERYEALVVRNAEGCWGWRGPMMKIGYACFGLNGKCMLAHRVSWELHHGVPPPGLDVMHLCHNPACSNPAHLALGTRSQNMQTSRVAGRLQRRIPLDDMPRIRAQRAAGITLSAIAARHGCTKQAVRHMLLSIGDA